MNKLHADTITKLIIQSHSLGQVDIAPQLLIELQKVVEVGERAINQPGLHVTSTKYTGVVHNLAEVYTEIEKDTKDFYTHAARTMTISYRYIYEAWNKINPNANELIYLEKCSKGNGLFVTFVRNRDSDLADKLYRAFGRSLNNLHYSIYMKRNKGVEHQSNSSLKDAGLLTPNQYIYYCVDESLHKVDDTNYEMDINFLYTKMRGLRSDSLGYDLINKFCLIDYNYFTFSDSDKRMINIMRDAYHASLVPLPVTKALLDEVFDFIGLLIDFIESRR